MAPDAPCIVCFPAPDGMKSDVPQRPRGRTVHKDALKWCLTHPPGQKAPIRPLRPHQAPEREHRVRRAGVPNSRCRFSRPRARRPSWLPRIGVSVSWRKKQDPVEGGRDGEAGDAPQKGGTDWSPSWSKTASKGTGREASWGIAVQDYEWPTRGQTTVSGKPSNAPF
jgi:hypothetical protein